MPLIERSLKLRMLRDDEEGVDRFIGGSAFLRVGGNPLWMQEGEGVSCRCGRTPEFVAGVGYEQYGRPSGIVSPGLPFFVGELASYFFLCRSCSRVVVVSQPT